MAEPVPVLNKLVQTITARGLRARAVAALRDILVADAELRNAKKKGRTRGTSSGSKGKGRLGVQMARDWLLGAFFELEPDDILIQTTSVGGSDLHFSPKAARLFPFAPESKRVQSLNVWGALHQAAANATKKKLKPVLFFSRNNGPLYIAFKVDDLQEWLHARGLREVCAVKVKESDEPRSGDQVPSEAGQ